MINKSNGLVSVRRLGTALAWCVHAASVPVFQETGKRESLHSKDGQKQHPGNKKIEKDPFGNLTDWGPVLDLLDELAENGTIAECQAGLIRILRYKGNWRLREEVLKKVNDIEDPCKELVLQIVSLLSDDNLYYDARILAGNALVQLSRNVRNGFPNELSEEIQKVVQKLKSTPHPPFFEYAVEKVHANIMKPLFCRLWPRDPLFARNILFENPGMETVDSRVGRKPIFQGST